MLFYNSFICYTSFPNKVFTSCSNSFLHYTLDKYNTFLYDSINRSLYIIRRALLGEVNFVTYKINLDSDIEPISMFSLYEQTSKEHYLMLNDDIDFIFSVGGGELMCQILPYIDFDKIKALKKKKLFMGYSDNTILTFTLPIFADSYAIYGECFPTFGVRKWDKSLKDAYALITGQEMIQHPYPKCADPQKHTDNPLKRDPYIKKTAWKRYQSDDPVTFKGILMGGCMDILNVICGTPYFEIDDYLEKHKKEGFIIFLEACEFHALAQKRAYWQFKNASLFKYCNGIIIGRPIMTYPMFDHTYVEMIDELKDLNIPIIYDVDIGHVPPSITLISGAMAEVHFEKNQKKCYLKHLIK